MKAVFFLRFESKVLKNALPADGYEDQYVLNFPAGTWILGIKIGLTKNKQVFSRFLCFLRSCLSLSFPCQLCLQEIRLIASRRQWVYGEPPPCVSSRVPAPLPRVSSVPPLHVFFVLDLLSLSSSFPLLLLAF